MTKKMMKKKNSNYKTIIRKITKSPTTTINTTNSTTRPKPKPKSRPKPKPKSRPKPKPTTTSSNFPQNYDDDDDDDDDDDQKKKKLVPTSTTTYCSTTSTLLTNCSSSSTGINNWDSSAILLLLGPDFCQIDALDLAPRLLGKHLRKDDVILQITEVEAYRPNDSACHGRFGFTPRTAPLFGPGGHAYVYLCYGLHTMLNVVADKQGNAAAVLIRSCSPVSGLQTIQQRRNLISDKPILLTGPGKVGQALGLSTQWSNHPLFTPGGLELLDGPEPEKIVVGPRVGIDYASTEHANALWRFAIAGSPWISAPKNTLRPP